MNDIELKKKLGLKIKQYRNNLNITQEHLAEKINLTQRQVSFIEIGKCFPSPETLVNISNFFDCSMKDLFDFESVKDTENIKAELHNMLETYSDAKLKTLYLIGKYLQTLLNG